MAEEMREKDADRAAFLKRYESVYGKDATAKEVARGKRGEAALENYAAELIAARKPTTSRVVIPSFGSTKPGRHTFAHATDIHIGSSGCDERAFCDFLDERIEEGVTVVACSGDILDGLGEKLWGEQTHQGWDAQSGRLIDILKKRKRLSWALISGNHDGYFDSVIGAEMGKVLQARLQAVGVTATYLGKAKGHCLVHGARVSMIHPHGGTSRRNGVRMVLNAYVENLVDEHPDIVLSGHFHKYAPVQMYPEATYCAGGGTFQQKATEFANRISAPWDIGGSTVSLTLGKDGKAHEISSRFYAAPRWDAVVWKAA